MDIGWFRIARQGFAKQDFANLELSTFNSHSRIFDFDFGRVDTPKNWPRMKADPQIYAARVEV